MRIDPYKFGDPDYGSVSLLMHCDGNNLDAGTSWVDSSSNSASNVLSSSDANGRHSTTESLAGGCSMRTQSSGYVSVASNVLYGYGTADFTIELAFRADNVTTAQVLCDQRPAADGAYPAIYITSSTIRYYVSTADRITSAAILSTNTWYRVAVSRVSGTTRMFVDGVQVGSNYADGTNYAGAQRQRYGIGGFTTGPFTGYFDEIRVTKGVGRYSADYNTHSAMNATFPNF